MSDKKWYKIEVNEGEDSTTHFYGSSSLTYEEVLKWLKDGLFIRLDDLLYMERGEYKEWAEWDKSLVPSIAINPKCVVTVMQYKADPRTFSK